MASEAKRLITMYTDNLMIIGYITEEWWTEWTKENGNLIDILIPEKILMDYYEAKVADKYDGIPFEKWYSDVSVAEDMDDLFYFTEWRPFLADITKWDW